MPSLTTDSKTPKYRARVKYLGQYLVLGRFSTWEEAKDREDAWWAKRGYPNGKRPWRNRVASG